MIRHLLVGATAILNSLNATDGTPAEPGPPDVDVRETCSCGASLMLEGPFDHTTIAAWVDRWRKEHPCQPNDKDATHIGAGASTERAWGEPHRSDSNLAGELDACLRLGIGTLGRVAPVGFNPYPPMGRVVPNTGGTA